MDVKRFFKKAKDEDGGFLTWSNLRDFSILVFCVALAYRLAVSDISIDLSGFGFTDLLSLILAISAIVLSAAFYFKADESSKSFYNNSYEFTKNISELLGRIEERFGAQLLNIHKGYDELNSKFGGFPHDASLIRAEQEKEREVIKDSEGKYQEIIDNLMVKAQLGDQEMASMREAMSALKTEAQHAKDELARHSASLIEVGDKPSGMSDDLFLVLKEIVREHFAPKYKKGHPQYIVDKFNSLVNYGTLPHRVIRELEHLGFYSNGTLTGEGMSFIRKII